MTANTRRLFLGALFAAIPVSSWAQSLDPQHYHPTGTMTGLSTVKGAASEEPWVWTLSTQAIYAKDPLVVIDANGDRRGALIANRVDLVISFAMGIDIPPLTRLGIVKGMDLTAVVPYVALQHQTATLKNGQINEVSKIGSGLADPRIEPRITLPIPDALGFDLAVLPIVSFPANVGGRYLGSDTVVFTPELAGSSKIGPVVLAANIGFRFRGESVVKGLDMSHQFLWRAGAAIDFDYFGFGKDFQVGVEAFGLTQLTKPFSITQTPFEVIVAGRYRLSDFVINAGVGPGLTSGYGAPAVRAILGFAWAPRNFDSDDDGVLDDEDACPEIPEDLDSFEDADGCPDPDNDGDGLLDADDACPDRAEDFDHFQDEDGCPDPDNDGDGITDLEDGCPLEAEDFDGFEDDDGCPDPDNDRDGILDDRDNCPDEPEDIDGYMDADGCPDLDNDGDKILDVDDECPLKPEDYNNNKDDDGCPDAADDKDGDGIRDVEDECPNEPEDLDDFEDEDGCPDLDNDQDGVPDVTDACPLEPEDMDGFMDDDGCPDEDNDGDGIWDKFDKCPNEAEVINGFEDDDGCPDEGAQLVRLTAQKIEISEKVYFRTGEAIIEQRSHGLLDQVATILENHRRIGKLRIEGHTDDRGSENANQDLSQRRADAVRGYLTGRGIEKRRLESIGVGEVRPVASNKSRAGREMNRRVEFLIVQEEAAQPMPKPEAAPSPPKPEDATKPAPPAKPSDADAPPVKETPTDASGSAPAAVEAEANVVTHALEETQSLRQLANALWHSDLHAELLLKYNPSAKDVDVELASGTEVKVPKTTQYTVRKGDLLGNIAKAQLGKVSLYKAIAAASKDVLPSPEAIDVGMELTIPLLHPEAARILAGR